MLKFSGKQKYEPLKIELAEHFVALTLKTGASVELVV